MMAYFNEGRLDTLEITERTSTLINTANLRINYDSLASETEGHDYIDENDSPGVRYLSRLGATFRFSLRVDRV